MISRIRAATFVLVLLFGAPLSLRAQSSAPRLIPIQGQITSDDGTPLEGTHTLHFALYDNADPMDAQRLYAETHSEVMFERGYFIAYLGNGEPEGAQFSLDLFQMHKDLFLGITVNEGDDVDEYLQLGTSGFAAFAQRCGDASSVEGLAGGDVQHTLTGSCRGDNRSIAHVYPDGRVECHTFTDRDTRVGAGDGLQGGTADDGLVMSIDPSYTQRRVTGTCGGGEFVQEVNEDGTVGCDAPTLDCVGASSGETGVAANTTANLTAECPSGYQVVGGGLNIPSGTNATNHRLLESYASNDTTWACTFHSISFAATVECTARCCRMQ